jgi:hypothetical protein
LFNSQAPKVKIDDKNGCSDKKLKIVSWLEFPDKPYPSIRISVFLNNIQEIIVVVTDVVIRYFIFQNLRKKFMFTKLIIFQD